MKPSMWPWFVLTAVIITLILKKDKNDKELQRMLKDEQEADEGLQYIKNYLAESK